MNSDILSPQAPVADAEILYRAVQMTHDFSRKTDRADGRISSTAFTDVGRRTLVDCDEMLVDFKGRLSYNNIITHGKNRTG
jgi:hypothetical protein